MRRLINKYIEIMIVFVIIYLIYAMPALAAENYGINDYMQIDIKENIDLGSFGSVEHSPELLDKIYTQNNKLINYVLLRDDNYHRNLIITYDLNGNETNRINLGTSYNANGKFYELKDKSGILLFTSYTNEVKRNAIIYLDNDGNKIGHYTDTSSSKNASTNRAIAEDDNYIYYATTSSTYYLYTYVINKTNLKNKKLSVSYKLYSPTSAKDSFHLYSSGKKIYVIYEAYYRNKSNVFYLLEFEPSISNLSMNNAKSYNIWKYAGEKTISNVGFSNDKIIILSGGVNYIYDIKTHSTEEYILDSNIESNLIYSNYKKLDLNNKNQILIWNDKNIELNINDDNSEIKIKTENDSCTLKLIDNNADIKKYDEFLIIKSNMQNVIIDKNMKIKIINDEGMILNLDDKIVLFYNKKVACNYYKIYDESDNWYEIININGINISNLDDFIYCGNNGLTIEGKAYLNDNTRLQISLGSIKKIVDVIDNKFNVTFLKEELQEGVYDDLKFNFIKDSKEYYYFDEIELGDSFYYDDVLYTKLDSTLGYEKYADTNYTQIRMTVASYDKDELDKYLSEEEYNKYKNYIFDEGKYRYWLSSANAACNKNIITVKAKNKSFSAYIRYKKEFSLNDKFVLNEKDGIYYYVSETKENSNSLNMKIYVSYEECIPPECILEYDENKTNFKLTIKKDNNENEKVKINYIIKNIDKDDEIKEIVLDNDDFYKNEDKNIYDIIFDTEGIYQFNIYSYNLFDNKSKIISLDAMLDFSTPEIINIEYENIFNYKELECSSKNEYKANVYFKELKASKYDLVDDYTYMISYELKNNIESEIVICDDSENETKIKILKSYIIDNEKPEVNITINDNEEFVEIILNAKDNLDFKKIMYSIDDSMYQIYENKIKLYKKNYKQFMKFKYYAVDIVNNSSDMMEEKINMNLKPEIDVTSKQIVKFDLNTIPKFKYTIFDLNKDALSVEIYLNEKMLEKKDIENDKEYILNLENYLNEINNLEYNIESNLTFVVSDGLLTDEKNIKLIKNNSEPLIDVYIKELNFKEFTQIDINCYDLDQDEVSYVIYNDKNKIMNGYLKEGNNKIYLKDLLNYGENKISFEFFDGYNKIKINKKIITKKDNDESGDIVIVKLKDNYDDLFIDFLINKYNDYEQVIINSEIDYENKKYNFLNIENIYLDDSILKNKYVFLKGKFNDSDLHFVSSINDENVIYIATNEEINIKEIKLFDYENDYSNFERKEGKDRLITCYYDSKKFENIKNENAKEKESYYLYDLDNRDEFKINTKEAGEYKISLNEYDYIYYDNVDYSKISDDKNFIIKVHNRPECFLKYTIEKNEDNNMMKLKINKYAYDKDYASKNNGISKSKLQIINLKTLDEVYISENNNDDIECVNLNSEYEYEIIYTVWDYGYDGNVNEFVLSNTYKFTIVYDPEDPSGYFKYDLQNEKDINYLYAYDNAENVIINKTIDFNDIFAKDNNQSIEFLYDENEITNLAIKNESINELENTMIIKNKFDRKFEFTKYLNLVKLDLINNTKLDYDFEDGFSKFNDLQINIEAINLIKSDDIKLMINDEIKMNNLDNNCFEYYLNSEYIKKYSTKKDKFYEANFDIYIYSNRDDSYLGKKTFTIKYYSKEEILDFNIIKVYDNNIKLNQPLSYNLMPVGDIKKGYAFEYEIDTEGMKEDDYDIMIDVEYYFMDKDKNMINKIDLMKKENNKLMKYEIPLYYGEDDIGTNFKIKLGNKQKKVINENEKWRGIFYVPLDSYVISDNNIQKDGYILVCFNIKAYKNDNLVYDFNNEKWNIGGKTAIYYANKSISNDILDYKIF